MDYSTAMLTAAEIGEAIRDSGKANFIAYADAYTYWREVVEALPLATAYRCLGDGWARRDAEIAAERAADA